MYHAKFCAVEEQRAPSLRGLRTNIGAFPRTYKPKEKIDMELLQVLRRIEKRDRETEDNRSVHHLIPPQEYGVTLIEPDDQDFIPAIQTAIAEHNPNAKVHLAIFPKGKHGDNKEC